MRERERERERERLTHTLTYTRIYTRTNKVIFEFQNAMRALVASAALDKVVRHVVHAFERRCVTLYGPCALDAFPYRTHIMYVCM